MCGRFTLHYTWAEMHEAYNLVRPEDKAPNVPARYNIAPTQDVLTVANADGERRLFDVLWWLVPYWAKELPKYTLFNARSEDADTKSSFRGPFNNRRCLIPADGYFEWTKNEEDGSKEPWHITLKGGVPFAFAGLWEHNSIHDITSCTILTAAADPAIEHLHHRMPIVLTPEVYDRWLNTDVPVPEAKELLGENLGRELVGRRVGREVNSSKASGDQVLDPLT